MSSHQHPGHEDFATRRRAPGEPGVGQQSFGGGFGTQSQWRTPDPRGPRPQFTAPQQFPPQQFPPHGTGYPSTPYGSQFQPPPPPGRFGQPFPAPQPYPGGYPQYPAPPQAPRARSVVPVILVCIVAVVAVLATVALVTGDDRPGGDNRRFKNDDYQVPPAVGTHPQLPRPTSQAEIKTWLEDNAIYQQDVAKPVRCELADFDHTSATSDQKKAQLEKTLECLVRVLGPTLEAAGFTITHPTVTMYSSPVQGACGKTTMRNAFYCSLDQNLYFATDLHTIFGAKSADQWAYEAVMAHEFGHSVQGRTGIIPARNIMLKDETSKEVAYLSVRRTEAQADCLAGLFFNSTQESLGLAPEDLTSIQNFYGSIGNKDPSKISTHPQPESRYRWFQTGITNTSVGTCNSFTVPADEVK